MGAPERMSFARRATEVILTDLSGRLQYVASQRWLGFAAVAQALPPATASEIFTSRATDDSRVSNDTNYVMSFFGYSQWRTQASAIRNQPTKALCFGSLSLFLDSFGPLGQADVNGSAGALALLPTAGALIGAPAQELWVLFKLMPLAGVLSMLLSLGGNIIPTEVRDYTANSSSFSYGGFIATAKPDSGDDDDADEKAVPVPVPVQGTEAERFAARVRAKAMQGGVGRKCSRTRIGIGIGLQLLWVAILVGTCCFVQSGGIIIWWCQAWAWMLLWYLTVVVSSLLANFAGVPFTEQWTIRVSRAPKLRISANAPIVVNCISDAVQRRGTGLSPTIIFPPRSSYFGSTSEIGPASPPPGPNDPLVTRKPVPWALASARTLSSDSTPFSPGNWEQTASSDSTLFNPGAWEPIAAAPASSSSGRPTPAPRSGSKVLHNFKRGYHIGDGVVHEASEPWAAPASASRSPFYVIISVEGISTSHALLRIVSKSFSIAVFGAGTCIFSSSTLITISVAAATLCLFLGVGVFGRVLAMWMANEMNREEPIIHQVVRSHREAGEHVQEVLAQPGLLFEIQGHVVVDGRCVKRYNRWFSLSTYLGVLAPPFSLASIKPTNGGTRRISDFARHVSRRF